MIATPPMSIAALWNPKCKGEIGLFDFLYTTDAAYAAMAGGGPMSAFGPAQAKLAAWKALDVERPPSTEAAGGPAQVVHLGQKRRAQPRQTRVFTESNPSTT